jgi:hypothetical protein
MEEAHSTETIERNVAQALEGLELEPGMTADQIDDQILDTLIANGTHLADELHEDAYCEATMAAARRLAG